MQPETVAQDSKTFRNYGEQSNYSRGKRAAPQVALKFAYEGIRFLYQYANDKKQKAKQLKATESLMAKLQASLEVRLKGIEDEILKNRITTKYGEVEECIRSAIDAHEKYKLTDVDDESSTKILMEPSSRKEFFSKAEVLPKCLEKLMNGFLGDHIGLIQFDLLQDFYRIFGVIIEFVSVIPLLI